jgi:hydroxyquinol 1,2-dioxygenase
MLEAADRSLMRPAHIHFMVSAPGYESVTTHIFEAADEYLNSDAVFGVKESLIIEFVRHEPGTAPDGTEMDVPYYAARYDFVLMPSGDANGRCPGVSEEARTRR